MFNMLSSVKIINWVKFNHSKERRSLVCLQLFTKVFWLKLRSPLPYTRPGPILKSALMKAVTQIHQEFLFLPQLSVGETLILPCPNHSSLLWQWLSTLSLTKSLKLQCMTWSYITLQLLYCSCTDSSFQPYPNRNTDRFAPVDSCLYLNNLSPDVARFAQNVNSSSTALKVNTDFSTAGLF